MNAAGRLGLFAAALVVAFASAFGIAAALTPDATDRGEAAGEHSQEGETMHPSTGHGPSTGSGTESGHGPSTGSGDESAAGLSLAASGYELGPISAPSDVGVAGELSFSIRTAHGDPLTDYTPEHEKELHLIVVRSDGAQFRHVHPTLDAATGTWSIPWQWQAAGTYRVFTDFTPGGGDGLTLSRTVEVAGAVAPVDQQPVRTATVDGFTATLRGDLAAGASGDLTIEITRDGQPVTALEPYLGAFGHLVALRQGDLAYLHVHPTGPEPEPGATSGPAVSFAAHAPTAGRYLLYFDFQVAGEVHTAQFVVDATAHTEE